MKVIVGDRTGEQREAQVPYLDRQLELLSDEATRRLVDGDALRVSWELALLLQEIYEDGHREELLRRQLPGWMDDQDVEPLLEAVAYARLPVRTDCCLRLEQSGRTGRAGYSLDTVWIDAQERPLRREPTVLGGIVTEASGARRRLTHGQYRLLQEHERCPRLGVDRATDMRELGRLSGIVEASRERVSLSRALARTEVVYVDEVEPRLVPTENGYEARPHAAGVDEQDLRSYLEGTPPEQQGVNVHSVRRPGGRRTRVAFAERARDGISDLREMGTLTPEQAAHAMSHPEAVFGPNIATDGLSDRVAGFGPNIMTAVPKIEPGARRGWLDGDWGDFALEPIGDGEVTDDGGITDLAEEEREELCEVVARAEEAGDKYVPDPRGRGFIEINERLKQGLVASKKPKASAVEVLQVHDNYETVNFNRAEPALATSQAAPDPPNLRPVFTLKRHQRSGYDWLWSLNGAGAESDDVWRGGLLADDMGLGKTLQVLAHLDSLALEGRMGPHLVVAPVALLGNWADEATKFFGNGMHEVREARGANLPRGNGAPEANYLSQFRVVLVSYETMARRERLFAQVHWDTVVLDEAQKIKNSETRVARVARTLKAQFRLVMTGTPVENRLRELWSLTDWALPGLLGSLRQFTGEYERPLKTASEEERAALARNLHARLEQVFVRRMKHDELGAELPPREEHDLESIPFSPEQEAAYGKLASLAQQAGRVSVGTLNALLAVCSHPRLVPRAAHLPSLSECSFPKAERLFELLDGIHGRNEKVIVFANRRLLQHWIATEIGSRYDVPVRVINGQINESRDRLKIIEQFSARPGFGVIVLSARAAGVGLNITAANHVIHYTREWNPAVENQATDRVYRIGQRRTVHVHTLAAVSSRGKSAESHLADMLREKRELMRDFVIPVDAQEVTHKELWERVVS